MTGTKNRTLSIATVAPDAAVRKPEAYRRRWERSAPQAELTPRTPAPNTRKPAYVPGTFAYWVLGGQVVR